MSQKLSQYLKYVSKALSVIEILFKSSLNDWNFFQRLSQSLKLVSKALSSVHLTFKKAENKIYLHLHSFYLLLSMILVNIHVWNRMWVLIGLFVVVVVPPRLLIFRTVFNFVPFPRKSSNFVSNLSPLNQTLSPWMSSISFPDEIPLISYTGIGVAVILRSISANVANTMRKIKILFIFTLTWSRK